MAGIAWNTDGVEKELKECDDLIHKANSGTLSSVCLLICELHCI